MAIKLKAYSDYLDSTGALLQIPVSEFTSDITEALRVNFNTAFNKVSDSYEWQELCPYGEARFVGNRIGYSNDLSQTSEWVATTLSITGNVIANPLDSRITASNLLEVATNTTHSVAHSALAIIPSTTYTYSAYVRPNGRSYVYLKINDGDVAHTAYFNVTTGAVGTAANCMTNIQNVGSGFWLCTMQFTTSTNISATTSSVTIQCSPDGSTLSYLGDVTKGLYVWGVLFQQNTNTGLVDSIVAFDQTGEERMDTIFQVWKDSPFNRAYPRAIGYTLTPDGIQILYDGILSYATVNAAGVTITTQATNPVFIYYRKNQPVFEGSDYSGSDTYAVDDQIYFTSSNGKSNYYKCLVVTSAGQSPDTTPTSWSLLQIPDTFFWSLVWWAYADWLTGDGQADKAAQAYQVAQTKQDDAMERESRQQARDGLPLRIQSHVTSQWRY